MVIIFFQKVHRTVDKIFLKIKEYSSSEIELEIKKISGYLNIEEFSNKLAKNLSGGTKKRLGIAMALIGNPKVYRPIF